MRKKRVPELSATDALRHRHAEITGELLTIHLHFMDQCAPWYRWTESLAIGILIQNATRTAIMRKRVSRT